MYDKNNNLADFDFSQFRAAAIEQLKSGQSLTGKMAFLPRLSKKFLKHP